MIQRMIDPEAPTPEDYQRVFEGDPVGRKVLEHLVRRFGQEQVTTGGIDAILETFERGGSRKVINYILGKIAQANDGDTEDERSE